MTCCGVGNSRDQRADGSRRRAGTDLAQVCQAMGGKEVERSGRERQGTHSGRGGAERVLPGPSLANRGTKGAGYSVQADGLDAAHALRCRMAEDRFRHRALPEWDEDRSFPIAVRAGDAAAELLRAHTHVAPLTEAV